jgi:hypothetical protein
MTDHLAPSEYGSGHPASDRAKESCRALAAYRAAQRTGPDAGGGE